MLLNVVPISFSTDTITIGKIQFKDYNQLDELRNLYGRTHVFRLDNRTKEIVNISLEKEIQPIGILETGVNINTHLLLIAVAIQESLKLWLADKLPILEYRKNLVYLGITERARLLSKVLNQERIPIRNDLEVFLKYEVDCRLFRDKNGKPFLGLVIDINTANYINLPINQLLQSAFQIRGGYICNLGEPLIAGLRKKITTLGKVERVQGNKLILSDYREVPEIDSTNASLVPSNKNLYSVIRWLYGSNGSKIINGLRKEIFSITGAEGKNSEIQNTLNILKGKRIELGNNLTVCFEELLEEKSPFYPVNITTEKPALLLGPQGRNTDDNLDKGIQTWGPYMFTQHSRNRPLIVVICEEQFRGRVEQFIRSLRDGFLSNKQGNSAKVTGGGLISKFRLANVQIIYEDCKNSSPAAYREAINKALDHVSQTPDLAIVQTKENFKLLYGENNPYYVAKASFMQVGIPVQAVTIEKMGASDSSLPFILNNVALAIYAKLDGIPWVISTRNPTSHEIVIGVGTSQVFDAKQYGQKKKYIGITTVFQGDGRYLVWGITKEAIFTDYSNALLETLHNVITHVKAKNSWDPGDNVKIIFHAYKRLKNTEIDAAKTLVDELVKDNYKVDFAFLDISDAHPYYLFDPSVKGYNYFSYGESRIRGKWVAPRGTALQLDKFKALLQLTGAQEIRNEVHGMPKPLQIEIHPNSDFKDLEYLVRQVYHFTYISWQSFSTSSEPVTTKYSKMVARLLGNLKEVKDWNSWIAISGNLRGRNWFL